MARFIRDFNRLMTESDQRWHRDAARNGWAMPATQAWKRLWLIRHVRWFYLNIQVYKHYLIWNSLGMISTGFDEWVLYGVRRGFERVK